MTIHYDIISEANLLIYVCTDTFTGAKFFEKTDQAVIDKRYKPQMKIIIDLISADINVSVSDLYLAVEKNKKLKAAGQNLGQTAVLTQSTSLNFLADSLKLISAEAPITFAIFHNRKDVISWLGLSAFEESISKVWDSIDRQNIS